MEGTSAWSGWTKSTKFSDICVFGTTTAMEDKQIKEASNWVGKKWTKVHLGIKDADKGDVFINGELRKDEILKGFKRELKIEECMANGLRSAEKHCFDNKIAQVGIVVRDWSRRDELVPSSTIEKAREARSIGLLAIQSVRNIGSNGRHKCLEWLDKEAPNSVIYVSLDNNCYGRQAIKKLAIGWKKVTKEGDEIRKRTVDLGGAVRQSIEKGGVSRMELDSFIDHITRDIF
ncbi:zeatin o-xylosyltransferase [Quercus suber]|uniref:Zeatin o-xylosyltransferase n=1 Tax=Quercus suber TaxID=58331 RepID=A0AAW0KYR4_QUESU